MNKVLIGIPTAPVLDFGVHEKAFQRSDWDTANRRWARIYGRFNGPATERQMAVRETWGKHVVPATLRFFVGRTGSEMQQEDVVHLDVADTYTDLPWKIQAMCRWAVDNGFDLVFKCDDDTFVHPGLVNFLQNTDHEFVSCLYSGHCASGGTGYALRGRALKAVCDADMATAHPECGHLEDHMISLIVFDAGVKAVHNIGFVEECNLMLTPKQRFSFHPVSPVGMRQMYSEFYDSKSLPD